MRRWDECHCRKRRDDDLGRGGRGLVGSVRGKCNLMGWRDCRFVRASVVDVGVDCRVEGSKSPCSCS